MQKSITAKNEKTQAYILYILLLIACILIFGQVIFFEFSLDDFLISENIPGRAEGWSGFWHLFLQRYNQTDYRPIVMMSYSLEKWAFNEINPSIAHFINLILFWIITMALYRLAHKFLNDEKYKHLFSVEEVNKLVLQGIPFRDAYKKVGQQIEANKFSYSPNVQHSHEGSIGNLCNDQITRMMTDQLARFDFKKIETSLQQLLA